MIRITHTIAIPEDSIRETFVRASGPGGQKVNKTASAVELRFDADGCEALPADMKARLRVVAGSRMTLDGVIVIQAESHRSRERNRADALARLVALLRRAAARPKPRRPTKPTKASKLRRLEGKARRGKVKRLRGVKPSLE